MVEKNKRYMTLLEEQRLRGCKIYPIKRVRPEDSPSPKILTTELLDEVLEFYNEEIEYNKRSIAKNKETIAKLEARIVKANVDLYEKISEEIDDCNESIGYLKEELENTQYLYNKFYFAKGILDNKSNAEDYELVYTKC